MQGVQKLGVMHYSITCSSDAVNDAYLCCHVTEEVTFDVQRTIKYKDNIVAWLTFPSLFLDTCIMGPLRLSRTILPRLANRPTAENDPQSFSNCQKTTIMGVLVMLSGCPGLYTTICFPGRLYNGLQLLRENSYMLVFRLPYDC